MADRIGSVDNARSRFAGRTALVTGGSRGIGASIAARLADDGARVAFTYTRSAEAAKAAVGEIEAAGGQALAIRADAGDPDSATRAVAETVERFGSLDIVVANAGTFEMLPISAFDKEAYERVFDVNVRGVVGIVRASDPHLSTGARVVLVGSINAHALFAPGLAAYGASKAAVAALGQGWARELGPRGATVNVVQPGPIDTDLNPASGEFAAAMNARNPLGRYGRTEEVAALVAFLASGEASYINGACIDIDGGFSA